MNWASTAAGSADSKNSGSRLGAQAVVKRPAIVFGQGILAMRVWIVIRSGSCASRPAQAVETTRIIRPLWIAERGRAAGEGVRGQRSPGGVDQARAGLDHDGHAAGPVDGEPELVGPHT